VTSISTFEWQYNALFLEKNRTRAPPTSILHTFE
jgi:hypothetical protein